MTFHINPLHTSFAGEVIGINLSRDCGSEILAYLREALDAYAVLVFRGQLLSDERQLLFAQELDGALHTKTGVAALGPNRFGNEAITDVSNIGDDGAILKSSDRRSQYALANRLWHTDASFESPRGKYSLLSARIVPEQGGSTEYADMRSAYDELDLNTKAIISELKAHHSIAYSRERLGFEFKAKEREILYGTAYPIADLNQRTGRTALYLAAHASHIVDWPIPDGRLLIQDLIEHAVDRKFVYTHQWKAHDLVIWDNLTTMHRGRPYDCYADKREMRRVTTLDC